MSDTLANKIAAGEVVERIASVVKELVENSIDAKSKNIIVDLIDAGTKEIKVTDDGVGMDKEDALLAFERHATSKIKKDEDLFFINTLGFRGEALASIASVSKVDLRTSEGEVGTHVHIEGGKLIENEECDARRGTIITIDDLFYNTPARLKYLKSDSTELANVTQYMEKLALANPSISFTLTSNERKVIYTSGSGDLLKVIHEVYGYTVSSNMIEINYSSDDFDISGYICKPVVLKSNRNHMTTIVNGRVVKNVDINRAINDGYFNHKPDIKYPVVVLNIETDPTLIDVNIHPSKADIKFSKLEELTEILKRIVDEALRKTLLVREMEINANVVAPSVIIKEDNILKEDGLFKTEEQLQMDYTKVEVNEVKHTFEEAKENVIASSDETKEINEDIKRLDLTPKGIVMQTFIIAEGEGGMYIIDQHAAHERINYEMVQKKMKEATVNKKIMLFPLTYEFNPSDYQLLIDKKDVLEELGFTIEEFGINTIAVKEHPDWLREGYEDVLIKSIFDILIEDATKFDRMKFLNRVAATTACKMSVRAHEYISLEQAKIILDDLFKCDNPYNCAHGRPTIVNYSAYELDRMFKRVMN
jgi:DNA mismatch repair protein MutL